MGRGAKVRIVAFVPSTLAEQYTALSKQSGLSRSELVRMALQRAHRSIVVWCEKHRDEFSGDEQGVVGSGSDRKEVPTPSPVAQLTTYCRVLVEQDPDLGVEQVRAMAMAQAAVVGVSSEQCEEVVASALEQLFPAELANGGDESGSVGGDLD